MPNSSRSRNLFEDERALQYKLIWSDLGYYKVRDTLNAYRKACRYPPEELKQGSYNFCRRKLLGKTLDEVREHVIDGAPLQKNSCK